MCNFPWGLVTLVAPIHKWRPIEQLFMCIFRQCLLTLGATDEVCLFVEWTNVVLTIPLNYLSMYGLTVNHFVGKYQYDADANLSFLG
jgi:hypothetical protein